jgi:uncharacterized protein YndB with AHSA1/START domain
MTTATISITPTATADIAAGIIVATVEIAAPAARVFRALTSADVAKWWGSAKTYRTTAWQGDVRVKGAWRADGIGSDGKAFSVSGEFLEVDPPRKVSFTWNYDWDGGGPTTTVTYQLDRTAAGTRLTVRHEGFKGNAASCESHTSGWKVVLGWLRDYVTASTGHEGGAS